MTAADLSAAAAAFAPTGMPPAVRSAIIWTLTDQGFPRHDAEAWANGWSCGPDPAMVAHQAITYDDHGIPIDQAIDWHQHGFYAADACCFYDAGYTPAQAGFVVDLAQTDDAIDDWLATGLPAARVIGYLRAQVNVDEVAEFESAPGGPDALVGALAALLA